MKISPKIYAPILVLIALGVSLYFIIKLRKKMNLQGLFEHLEAKKKAFITAHAPAVLDSVKGTPLLPSVVMAQMIQESGWGSASPVLSGTYNNYFGIKAGKGWKGKITPSLKDAHLPASDRYRAYNSPEESIKDHNKLLLTLSRYAKVKEAQTPEGQAWAIDNGGYAVPGAYAPALIRVIESNNLKALDTL